MKHLNNIKQFALVSLLGMGLGSCLDLDPVVYDKIIPENFYKTEADARAAVTGIYSPLGSPGEIYGGWTETFWMINNLCADDMGTQRDDYEFMEKFQWNSTTYAAYKFYTMFVKEVHRTTLVIDDLLNSPIDEKVKKQYVAELQCIRGQYLFFLYDFYGTASVTTDAEILRHPEDEVILERLPKDEFVKLIETDLKAAAEVLPVSYDASEYGRLSKGAAYTILENSICRRSVGQMLRLIAARFRNWDTSCKILIHQYSALRTNATMRLSGHCLASQSQMVMEIPGLLTCFLPNFPRFGQIARYKDGMYIICRGDITTTISTSRRPTCYGTFFAN